jgi:hypothetical protein
MALLLLFDAPALHSWQIIAWLVGWAGCILSFLWPLLRSAVARFLLHAGTVASLGSFYFWVWSDTTTSSAVPFLAAMVINLVWLLTAGLRLVPRGIDPADGTVKKQ